MSTPKPAQGETTIPRVKPNAALDYFRQKGFQHGFSWQDVWQDEHARAFTVAKAMSRDVLETIRQAVDDAIANGETLEMFRAKLTPLLQSKGWWGKQEMVDPLTGKQKLVQLGSPRRLKTIYDINIRMAMAAGQWQRYLQQKDLRPYLRYLTMDDERVREEHAAWHGIILPIDHPWWRIHYPPCGHGCRCDTDSFSDFELAQHGLTVSANPPPPGPPREFTNRRTGEITEMPAGIDPGFAYNAGEAWLGGLAPPPLLPAELPALEEGVSIGVPKPGAPEPAALLPETATAEEAAQAFLDGAGVPRSSGAAGAVVQDINGYPLAISDSWFRNPAGELMVPTGDRRRVLGLVGRALKQPTQILWKWVKGKDGKAILFRRYIARVDGLGIALDISKQGWRYATEREAGFDLSRLSRSGPSSLSIEVDGGAAFEGMAGELRIEAYAATAMREPSLRVPAQIVGTYGTRLAEMVEGLGITAADRHITLEAPHAIHILKGHSIPARELARGQIPVDIVDLGKLSQILSRVARVYEGEPPVGRSGQARIELIGIYDGARFTVVGERRKRGFTVVTMWKQKVKD